MVSLRTTFLALAAAVAVSADYYIDPDSVDPSTRSMSISEGGSYVVVLV